MADEIKKLKFNRNADHVALNRTLDNMEHE